MPNFCASASVFDNCFHDNISRSNATLRGGYTFPYVSVVGGIDTLSKQNIKLLISNNDIYIYMIWNDDIDNRQVNIKIWQVDIIIWQVMVEICPHTRHCYNWQYIPVFTWTCKGTADTDILMAQVYICSQYIEYAPV